MSFAASWNHISLLAAFFVSLPLGGYTQEPLPPPTPYDGLNPLISKIAFGSCSHQDRPQPVLRAVVDQDPQLFVYLGDNIYGDTKDMKVLAAKYGRLAQREEFKLLRHNIPTIATWDDHDYGWNDAGKEYPFKVESKEVFCRFWQEPVDSPRLDHEGIYTSYQFSDPANPTGGKRLQVILLDTRTFRDPLARNKTSSYKNAYHPDPNPEKTLLGEAQWRWLEKRLREPADLRIIGSSIQFGHEYNGWESWTNFPSELWKMVSLVKATKANGVVFISGDVHWGELSKLKARGCYPIYDLTASGINRDWPTLEPNRNRIGEACRDHHFGLLEMDWLAEEPTLEFRIHDVTGSARLRHKIKLNEIQFESSTSSTSSE